MPSMTNVNVYVIVNDDGEFHVGRSEEEVLENYHGEFENNVGLQGYCLTLKVPLPEIIELSIAVPEGVRKGEVTATVKQT